MVANHRVTNEWYILRTVVTDIPSRCTYTIRYNRSDGVTGRYTDLRSVIKNNAVVCFQSSILSPTRYFETHAWV